MGHSEKERTENLHLLQNIILFKIADFNSPKVSKPLWQTMRAGLNTEQKTGAAKNNSVLGKDLCSILSKANLNYF